MKQKITFKLCLAMLGLLLSFSAGAQEVIIGQLKYTLYDDGTASVAAANKSTISEEIVIPASIEDNNKTYSVTTIGVMAFEYCSGLTAITIPNSVTTIDKRAFFSCSGLTAITIGNSVTTIGVQAFYDCSGLTAITIPNSVTTIDQYAFWNCSGLTSITIPNSVTTIDNYTFAHCRGLTSITIPNSVTKIFSSTFWGCTGLKEFIVAINNPNYSSLDGILYNKQQTEIIQAPEAIKSVNIPNSVTTIGNSAFNGCSGLTAITIPNSVTTIGEGAFSGCSGLTAITIPNSVTKIDDYAFSSCSGLTSITIPNNVTTISYRVFYKCSGLTTITIGNSVTTISDDNFDGAFFDCSGLKEFIVAKDNSNYSSSNGILYNKQQTEIIQAPQTIKSVNIPNNVTTIGDWAFYGCSGLTAITIPNSVKTIGNFAFQFCSGLTAITISNSVKTISNNAFWGCSGLTAITIPNSVKTIGYNAFGRCSGLTAITIPNSVTTIGRHAFYRCYGLQEIKVYVEEPIDIDSEVFGNVDYSTCKLYVPQGSIDKYKAANIWKLFTNILALADGSAIEGVDEDKLNVYSIDGKVVIKNLREGEAISICNTTGQNVYQGNETEVPLSKGIYFVKVGTIVSKVMVQ